MLVIILKTKIICVLLYTGSEMGGVFEDKENGGGMGMAMAHIRERWKERERKKRKNHLEHI